MRKLLEYGVEKRSWEFCDSCNTPIPVYENGSVVGGYVSPEIWNAIPDSAGGVGGIRLVHRTVCNRCFRDAFARQYPGEPQQLNPEEGSLPEWVTYSLANSALSPTTSQLQPS